MCAPGFPQHGKESGNVETQPAVGKLPPSNTSQTHGNPPGLKSPHRPNQDFDDEKQNKSEQEESEFKQAQTRNSRY